LEQQHTSGIQACIRYSGGALYTLYSHDGRYKLFSVSYSSIMASTALITSNSFSHYTHCVSRWQ